MTVPDPAGDPPEIGNYGGGIQAKYNWAGYLQDVLGYKKALQQGAEFVPYTLPILDLVEGGLE